MKRTACLALNLILVLIAICSCVIQNLPTNAFAATAQCANFTNLIVFAKFSGEEEFIDKSYTGTSVWSLIDNSYSKAEYSVKDYFYCASNGKVNMQNLYLLGNDGGSITLEKERAYYCEKDQSNPLGYESYEYESRMNDLKRDWANAIISAVASGGRIVDGDGENNFSVQDLDKNSDGYIDAITIIYKYSDAYSGVWKGCLWNYQAYSNYVELNGVNDATIRSNVYVQMTYDYNYAYTSGDKTTQFANLKTMIHETGHIFGLKDLYNAQNNSPVYYMSAMSNAISIVPQYISAKEREALGWLDANQIITVNGAGTYTVDVASSQAGGTVCYKCDVPSLNKTLYLEYRKFDGTANKYDTQNKTLFNYKGEAMKNITIKSGLICFLVDKDTTFPNNMYSSPYNWNYQVLGGKYATKSDAALASGDSLQISSGLSVSVKNVTDTAVTFELSGNDFATAHKHDLTKTEYKAPTCTKYGNIEYYYCSGCEKYFTKDMQEIAEKDVAIAPAHSPVVASGYESTCSSEGLTDGTKCSECGAVIKAGETIAKKPHTESEWIIEKDSTFTEEGSKYKKCLHCEKELERQTIPVKQAPPNKDDEKPPVDKEEPDDDLQTPTKPPAEPDEPEQPNKTEGVSVWVYVGVISGVAAVVGVVIAIIKIKKIL